MLMGGLCFGCIPFLLALISQEAPLRYSDQGLPKSIQCRLLDQHKRYSKNCSMYRLLKYPLIVCVIIILAATTLRFTLKYFDQRNSEIELHSFIKEMKGKVVYWPEINRHSEEELFPRIPDDLRQLKSFEFPKDYIGLIDFSDSKLTDSDLSELAKILVRLRIQIWQIRIGEEIAKSQAHDFSIKFPHTLIFVSEYTYYRNGNLINDEEER